MAGVQTDVALLKEGQIRHEKSQIRLEARINELAADVTGIKEGQAEIQKLLLGNRN